MKKLISIVLILFFITPMAFSQKYITKNGKISFYSDAPMEKIEAHNSQVNAALDASTGDLVFRVLMKSFIFEKALMQEHFNEKYLESEKYPKSTFSGKVEGFSLNGFQDIQVDPGMNLPGFNPLCFHISLRLCQLISSDRLQRLAGKRFLAEGHIQTERFQLFIGMCEVNPVHDLAVKG